MNPQQIASVANAAGFSGEALRIAVAVALAESSGNPTAGCHNCLGKREDSRGLWQINVYAHPQYASVNLFDPLTNARAAWDVSNGGTNWYPWTTFKTGAYRNYLPASIDGGSDSAPLPGPETVTLETDFLSGLPGWALPAGLIALAFVLFRR